MHYRAQITWQTTMPAVPDGWQTLSWPQVAAEHVAPARRADVRRATLAAPAAGLFFRLEQARGWVVDGVTVRSARDLADVHGYLIEPCARRGIGLTVVADRGLEQLGDLVDDDLGHASTIGRLRWLLDHQHAAGRPVGGVHTDTLDDAQRAAALAGDGVVQVIAPAGSGKTTVLISRVAELLARGVKPDRILCTTFNRDARVEMQTRMAARGLGDVRAQTFHSVGWTILKDARSLRRGGVRELSLGQWRRLSAMAARQAGPDGEWIDPPLAKAAIGDLKLGHLITPDEFAARRAPDARTRTLQALYRLYEQELARSDLHDFDDLVMRAVLLLRDNEEIRHRWQGRYDQLLVDEFQDIEPAQELLVRILAAPQDNLFVVGDDDQVLYSWRRASVERIVGLDVRYPGLQRVALAHNYRCPAEVVQRSRVLIEGNQRRFPKAIHAAERREVADDPRPLIARAYPTLDAAAVDVAAKLSMSRRGDICVLARTTRLLRQVAAACATTGVKISAPEQVFEPTGARGAVEAYSRLFADPRNARADDVVAVMRHPGRGLPYGAEDHVADSLRTGRSFHSALLGVPGVADHARHRLQTAARVFDELQRSTGDARRFMRVLRGPGGLDEHFATYEQLTGGTEAVEVEVLEDLQRAAAGLTVAQLADRLTEQTDALRAIRDDEHGIEVTTIHRAKGRQWPTVICFGADEQQLPHKRAVEAHATGDADALEAERRLAYVAFTRAQQRLVVLHTEESPSRFLVETGLAEPPAAPALSPAAAPERSWRPSSAARPRPGRGRLGQTSYEAARRALHSPGADVANVLGSCASEQTARKVAAMCVRDPHNAPAVAALTVADLLDCLPGVDADTHDAALAAAAAEDPVGSLEAAARKKLAAAIRTGR